jgi:hypothetical protein
MRRNGISTRVLATTVLAIAAVATAGCGSSPKPLTRAELATKANAICKKATVKLEAVAKKGVRTVQAIAHVAPELATFEETALVELSKLIPPAELEEDWKAFVAGAQTLAENTSKIGEDAKANDLKSAKGLVKSSTATQKQMIGIAKRDGIKECEQVS